MGSTAKADHGYATDGFTKTDRRPASAVGRSAPRFEPGANFRPGLIVFHRHIDHIADVAQRHIQPEFHYRRKITWDTCHTRLKTARDRSRWAPHYSRSTHCERAVITDAITEVDDGDRCN